MERKKLKRENKTKNEKFQIKKMLQIPDRLAHHNHSRQLNIIRKRKVDIMRPFD